MFNIHSSYFPDVDTDMHVHTKLTGPHFACLHVKEEEEKKKDEAGAVLMSQSIHILSSHHYGLTVSH